MRCCQASFVPLSVFFCALCVALNYVREALL
eukprot:COSAG05_NODE_9455_length_622_cov_1.520076_2_plen_30_part_01